jgi:hypothetical protein
MTKEEIIKRSKEYDDIVGDETRYEVAQKAYIYGAIEISNYQIDEAIEIVNYPWETTNADIIITAITHRLENLKIKPNS